LSLSRIISLWNWAELPQNLVDLY